MTGKVYATIAQYLGQLGEQPSGPPFVVYYNMDMQNLDVEIGFPVAKRLTGQGEIKTGELPSGTVATCLHVGPYSDIGSAYEALTHWVNEHGYTPTGVAYEVYLNDPAITRPEELRTQVMYPLKPR
jgi:effector-binding domain-containing protein